MKQRYLNKTFTRTRVKNNILRVWDLASDADKYDWYKEAYNFAVKEVSLRCQVTEENINKVCGIIAALSPRQNWNRNKLLTKQFLADQNPDKLPCMKQPAYKADKILRCDGKESTILKILNGPKTSSFYLNIRYPDKAISLTIDTHALNIAIGERRPLKEYQTLTAKQYKFFEDCYRYVAAKIGVNPLLLQSATWLVWRRDKNLGK